MSSYVGLSSTARAKLEQQARKLKGTLIVTRTRAHQTNTRGGIGIAIDATPRVGGVHQKHHLVLTPSLPHSVCAVCCLPVHKASHLKNSALFGSGAESDPFVVLRVGSQVFESLTARKGGAHPKFEQQFVFHIGPKDEATATTGGAAAAAGSVVNPASPKASADDGALHVRIYDRSLQGGECIGRVDLNFVQLLQASATASAAQAQVAPASNGYRNGNSHADVPSATNTRWHAVSAASDLRVQAGWLCITATFKGTGLPSETEASSAAEHAQTDAPVESSKAKQKLADGEYKVNFNEAPPASAADEAAAAAAAGPSNPVANGSSDASSTLSESSSSPLARSSLLPPLFPISAMLEAPPAAPIVLTLPNPHLEAVPLPPPADAASAYYQSPAAGWPTPKPNPPAPGYSAPETVSGPPLQQLGSPSSRVATAAGERPMSPPAVTASAGGSTTDSASASEDSLNLDLITAFDQRHPHILQLQPRVASGRFLCAACAGEGHSSVYHCTQGCSYAIHEGCLLERVVDSESEDEADAGQQRVKFAATPTSPPRTAGGTRKPDMRRDPRHPHPLTWMPTVWHGTYLCGGCGGGGSGPAWQCTSCVWALHLDCCR